MFILMLRFKFNINFVSNDSQTRIEEFIIGTQEKYFLSVLFRQIDTRLSIECYVFPTGTKSVVCHS